jgi:hypothetical protein
VSKDCLFAIADEYRRQGASKRFRSSIYSMDNDHFEESIRRSTENKKEQNWIRARFYDGVGNRHLFCGEDILARKFYVASLRNDPGLIKVYGKLILLLLGKPGGQIRKRIRGIPASINSN